MVNQLLTLIDGADASMGGVTEDSDDEGEGGKDGGSSNQVCIPGHYSITCRAVTYSRR